MSRSKKDGARRGGHLSSRLKEIWSRRCPKVNMATPGRWAKHVTHRWERRVAKREIENSELAALNPSTESTNG